MATPQPPQSSPSPSVECSQCGGEFYRPLDPIYSNGFSHCEDHRVAEANESTYLLARRIAEWRARIDAWSRTHERELAGIEETERCADELEEDLTDLLKAASESAKKDKP